MSSSAKSVTRVAEMRAKRGARWLDENVPGWWKRINMRTLQLSEGNSCICGQVFRKDADADWSAVSGFDYARSHLFAEANSWVSTIVGPVGTINRKKRVGVALGFVDGNVPGNGWWSKFKSDRVEVRYPDLQKAWVKLVRERQAAARS